MNLKSLSYLVVAVALLGGLYAVLRPKESATINAASAPVAAPSASPATQAPTVTAAAPSAAAGASPQPSTVPAPAAAAPSAGAAAEGASAPTQTATQASAKPAAEAAAKPFVFEIVLRNGRRTSGPAVLKVKKDDDVTLSITADKADQLHLHGYDLRANLAPGKTATLNFKATLTGRFAYELHHAGTEVGALEVYPR